MNETALAHDDQPMSAAEVGERFRWAKRQGRPAWLWPDIAVADWQEALASIAFVLRHHLSGGAGAAGLAGAPLALGLACYTSGTGPLLGWWHEQSLLIADRAISEMLERHLRHNRTRAARMAAAATGIVDALGRAHIPVVMLKGAHTGQAYFPDPATRPAADIDILVAPHAVVAAEDVLASAGFVLIKRGRWESSWQRPSGSSAPQTLMFVHADDPWSIDLHGSLTHFIAAGAPCAELDRGNPMASVGRWSAASGAAVLDQPLLLLHLAVHAGAGLHNLTLLRLAELQLVIRRDVAAGRLCWDDFLAMAGRAGARGYAYPALRLCEQLAPGIVPPAVLDRCARQVPRAVLRVLDRLTPATAQRIERTSIAEHFMWSNGWAGRLRQIAADLAPADSWKAGWSVYEKRAWRLFRGTFSG